MEVGAGSGRDESQISKQSPVISFGGACSEPQNIEKGISNGEVPLVHDSGGETGATPVAAAL